MEHRARTLHLARPAAMTAACAALLALVAGPATADAKAKRYPVVSSISPMSAKVGETISIRGKYFRRGKNRNTVVFKRDGARAVFAKQTLGTAKLIRVVVPDALRPFLTEGQPARVRVRVLSERFSKAFTPAAKSPMITAFPKPVTDNGTGTDTSTGTSTGTAPAPAASPSPEPAPAPAPPQECHGDDDNDLMAAALENTFGLNPCKADSDDDGVPDGYEYQSAIDLNDDEYQDPNLSHPYPGKRPYPNPLDDDADADHDGDSLTLREEYRLWARFGNTDTLADLVYSAGEQYSLSERDGTGRRRPTEHATGYLKAVNFQDWAEAHGYRRPKLSIAEPWHAAATQVSFWLFDFNRSSPDTNGDGIPEGLEQASLPGVDYTTASGYIRPEVNYYDLDRDTFVSDDERDEDEDGLTNYDEAHGRATREYWAGCYSLETPYKVSYANLDLTDKDSDDDGIRDGADDQDHDDIPNVMELSRNAASGHVDWDPEKGKCSPNDDLLNPDDGDLDSEPESKLETLHPDDYGRVNPFNPCLPYTWSRTCDRHPGLDGASAPFDGSPNWFALQ